MKKAVTHHELEVRRAARAVSAECEDRRHGPLGPGRGRARTRSSLSKLEEKLTICVRNFCLPKIGHREQRVSQPERSTRRPRFGLVLVRGLCGTGNPNTRELTRRVGAAPTQQPRSDRKPLASLAQETLGSPRWRLATLRCLGTRLPSPFALSRK